MLPFKVAPASLLSVLQLLRLQLQLPSAQQLIAASGLPAAGCSGPWLTPAHMAVHDTLRAGLQYQGRLAFTGSG